jgi:hypothetical protein
MFLTRKLTFLQVVFIQFISLFPPSYKLQHVLLQQRSTWVIKTSDLASKEKKSQCRKERDKSLSSEPSLQFNDFMETQSNTSNISPVSRRNRSPAPGGASSLTTCDGIVFTEYIITTTSVIANCVTSSGEVRRLSRLVSGTRGVGLY